MVRRRAKPKSKTKAKAKRGKATARRKAGKKPLPKKKIFFLALGIAATGGAIYLVKEYLKNKNSETIIYSAQSSTTSTKASASSGKKIARGDSFPLKRGSKGPKVKALQEAIERIIGAEAMNSYGGVDGDFGPGTESALKKAGLPTTVTEKIFNNLASTDSSLKVIFDPQTIAKDLYRNAANENLSEVLRLLGKLKTVDDYTAVNNYYKKQGLVSKTIVTDLLEIAFKDSVQAKDSIKAQFIRIGLKNDADNGRWSLSGFRPFNDIVTLRNTYVEDMFKNRIPVKRNTILGDEISASNGMTFFRALDNSVASVPTQDIRYVNN